MIGYFRMLLMLKSIRAELRKKITRPMVESWLQHESFAVKSILCYGIGSLQYSNSRKQFSLLHIIKDFVGKVDVLSYDPIMDDVDKRIFRDHGYYLIEVNEEAKRSIPPNTLVYMPRCPLYLYENIFSCNFRPEVLERVVIIGNNYRNMKLQFYGGEFEKKFKFISKLLPYMEITKLPTFDYTQEFEGLVITKLVNLPNKQDEFWRI